MTMEDKEKNRLIIIGLGEISRELIGYLSDDVFITCLDKNPDKAILFEELGVDGEFITGDATSRLILKGLPISEAEAVIITTTSEETNIEIVSLLMENFHPRRVISVGLTGSGIERMQELSAEVEPVFHATALGIKNRLQPRTRSAHGIGLGKGEILEVEVHPHSRLANRRLGDISPIRWRIGLVYRGENIMIPKYNIVIKPGDRLLLLGDPTVLKTVSELFTFSFQRFPLEYGSSAVVYISGYEDESYLEEIEYILKTFPLKRAFILFEPRINRELFLAGWDEFREFPVILRQAKDGLYEEMRRLFVEMEDDQGMVVFSGKMRGLSGGLLNSIISIKEKMLIQRVLGEASSPLLIARGTFPYKELLVPALSGLNYALSLEKSIEISRLIESNITALLTEPPRYTASEEERRGIQEIKKEINSLSMLHKKSITITQEKGNPVKVLNARSVEYNLTVLGSAGWERRGWLPFLLNPDLLWFSVVNTVNSTLILPGVEEAL
ncbi:MAG: hypothetical protein D6726_04195 [Nitrospirae bacterium]|nr:MAG: hypothetical protein D6726_04195 [Nitrospirota bacterium]